MESEFWLQRWQEDRIGFHQDDINPHLQAYWPLLGLEPGAGVFVPLCGKSRDMCWLGERHPVLGIELSPRAVEDFFAENELQPARREARRLSICSAGPFTLMCGDFFDLQPADTAHIGGIYDRAALIALPRDMRPSYAQKLAELAAPGTSMLLVTMEYDQPAMDGPPFSVEAPEVHTLFGRDWQIRSLHRADILEAEPRFRAQGISYLFEHVYLLVRQASGA